MKSVLFLLLVFFTRVSHSQTEQVWIKIEEPPLITVDNASSFEVYENTPESVLNYFYASRIRKDREWEKVVPLPEDRSEELDLQLERYNTWTITNFHLVSISVSKYTKALVKVYFKIEMNGRSEDGVDTAKLKIIDGKWTIISVPT